MANILVVDDESGVRSVLKQLLERTGHCCIAAGGSAEARELLREQPFDLLIADINMPGETGLSLVADVRRRYPDLACIFLSGVDDPESIQNAIDLGVHGYIVKPFSGKGVLIGVANALQQRRLELENRQYRQSLEKLVAERTRNLEQTIRQLQRREQELIRSREEYRHLMISLPSIVYRGYPDWTVDFVGDRIEDVTGYGKQDFDSRRLKWSDLVLAEDFDQARRDTLVAVKAHSHYLREYRIRHRDGRIVWIQDRGQPLYDANGRVTYIHGVALDVTEQKQAQEQLRSAREEVQLLLDAISSILIGIDGANRIKRWNQVAEKVFGLAAAAVLNQPLGECGIPWNWSGIAKEIARCRRRRAPVRIDDVRFTRADGRQGFLGITLNPIDTDSSEGDDILLMAADITERKLLESQLGQAQKLESIGQLAAGIAHEINTPTQYVGDNIRFLKDSFQDLFDLIETYQSLAEAVAPGADTAALVQAIGELRDTIDLEYLREEIPKAIAQSIDGVERVAKIVLAMKEFSHPGTDEKKLVDINKAIESTITVSRNEWKYVAELHTDLDPNLGLVPCLASELNQVFLNIIVNAAHAIGDAIAGREGARGTVTIATRPVDDWCEIRISDSGCGIPKAIRHRVFDPFFTTKEVGKGTGQGLAIAHDVVVNKHQGTLAVESEVGAGTTFIIRLPVTVPAATCQAVK